MEQTELNRNTELPTLYNNKNQHQELNRFVFFSRVLAVLTRVPQQINGKPVFSKTTAAHKVGQVKT
jgi:hypothetical protein